MTLYLKYRPRNLDELDEVSVSESLKSIVLKKTIPHAFLFAGPKGTGKTSAARILAKIINCENIKGSVPCDKCEECKSIEKGNNLDVIEMDAASHRGIDDVRILRDAVKLAPTKASKKIYIIDEAHMLTTEASNALLKTLEEPPDHVVFILATTNPEKLIDTIRSRTTFIPFTKAKLSEITKSLKRVADGEKIKIDEDALGIIAKAADGSFRDAIKILEQLVATDTKLTKEFLEEFLFKNKSFDLDEFINLLVARNTKKLIEEIGKLGTKGVEIDTFLEALIKKLRLSLLSKVGVGTDEIKELNKDEIVELIELLDMAMKDISNSVIEELPLEIAIIKWCEGEDEGHLQPVRSEINSHPAKGGTGHDVSRSETFADHDLAQTKISDTHMQANVQVNEGMEVNNEVWKSILAMVKPINASVEALLRAARPMSYDGKVLTLGVYYKFHKERLEDTSHRRIVEDIVTKVLQSPAKIVCTLVDPPPKKIVEIAKEETILTEGNDRDIMKAAEEIFSN